MDVNCSFPNLVSVKVVHLPNETIPQERTCTREDTKQLAIMLIIRMKRTRQTASAWFILSLEKQSWPILSNDLPMMMMKIESCRRPVHSTRRWVRLVIRTRFGGAPDFRAAFHWKSYSTIPRQDAQGVGFVSSSINLHPKMERPFFRHSTIGTGRWIILWSMHRGYSAIFWYSDYILSCSRNWGLD